MLLIFHSVFRVNAVARCWVFTESGYEVVSESDKWVRVASPDAVQIGSVIGMQVEDVHIALYNIEGEIYATHNICTHAYAYLSEGWLEGDIIECPLHGGRFEVKTGKGLGAPITCDIKTLPVRIEGGDILVNVG